VDCARLAAIVGFAICAVVALPALGATDTEFAAQREQMVAEIAAMARATGRETGRERFSDPVMKAMATVARHRFVPESLAPAAYRNRPLPIGQGQTISQPYIVALSTDLLEPKPGHVVLEIGTGSGYQAAVLAELVERVYSIEIVEPLGREAAARLTALGYRNVAVRIGDGYQGWPDKAPFDGIIVTAAAPSVPAPLVQQLKPGGKMVIPVGRKQGGQELLLVEKTVAGSVLTTVILPVRFVPLTGKGAEERPQQR
jgi:protein-L-isoaspartate(D-aspartate) O-methyltransferase